MRPAERLNLNLLNPVVIESKAIRHNEQPKLKVKFSDGSTVITLVNILEGAKSAENMSTKSISREKILADNNSNKTQSAEIKTSEGTSPEKEFATESKKHVAGISDLKKSSRKQRVANSNAPESSALQNEVETHAAKSSAKQQLANSGAGNTNVAQQVATTDVKNSPKIEWVKNLGGNIFMTSPLIT